MNRGRRGLPENRSGGHYQKQHRRQLRCWPLYARRNPRKASEGPWLPPEVGVGRWRCESRLEVAALGFWVRMLREEEEERRGGKMV